MARRAPAGGRRRPTFAILASGRGSNAVALMRAFASGFVPATLTCVVADRAEAAVLERAAEHGVAPVVVPRGGVTRAAHEAALLRLLAAYGAEHLLLAGYTRLLSGAFLGALPGTVLNIHPALLPEFPGLDAPARQWAAGRTVVGATVHVVDEGVDTGPILLQGSLLRRPREDAASLADRLRTEVEHVIYPRAVRLFVERGERR